MKATMVHARGATLAVQDDSAVDQLMAMMANGPTVPQSWISPAGLRCSFDEHGRFHASPAQAAANGDNKAPAGPVDEAGALRAKLGRLKAERDALTVRLDQAQAAHQPESLLRPMREELSRLDAEIGRLEPRVRAPGQSSGNASLEAEVRELVAKEPNVVASVDAASGVVRTILMPRARPLPGAAETMADKLKRSHY